MVLESYLRDMASEFYVDPEEDSEGADQRRFTQLEKNQPGWPSIVSYWLEPPIPSDCLTNIKILLPPTP